MTINSAGDMINMILDMIETFSKKHEFVNLSIDEENDLLVISIEKVIKK